MIKNTSNLKENNLKNINNSSETSFILNEENILYKIKEIKKEDVKKHNKMVLLMKEIMNLERESEKLEETNNKLKETRNEFFKLLNSNVQKNEL